MLTLRQRVEYSLLPVSEWCLQVPRVAADLDPVRVCVR